MNRVKALSVKLIDLLDSYQKNKELDYEHEFNDIKLEFIEIKSMFNDDISLVNTKYVGKQLNELGNEISIVFQNCAGDKNVLFTGDFGKITNWKFIENNRDGIVYMHQKYNVIKVPHHGTKVYYHSFVDRMSNCSIFLIPNGYNSGSWGIHSNILMIHLIIIINLSVHVVLNVLERFVRIVILLKRIRMQMYNSFT